MGAFLLHSIKTGLFGIGAVWFTFAYLYYQNAEIETLDDVTEELEGLGDDLNDTKDGVDEVKDSSAAITKARIVQQKNFNQLQRKISENFARKAKALQRLIVGR